jgi:hypothetical protein
MADLKKKCSFFWSCFSLRKTASKTHKLFKKPFGDNAMGIKEAFESRLHSGVVIFR